VVRSEGGIGTLSIFGVRTLDVGEFSCQVVSAQYGTQLALMSIAVNVTDGNYIHSMMHCCSTVCIHIFHAFNVLAQVLVILGASRICSWSA